MALKTGQKIAIGILSAVSVIIIIVVIALLIKKKPVDADSQPPPTDPYTPPTDPYTPPTDPYTPPTDPYTPPTDPYTPPTDPYTPPTDPYTPPPVKVDIPMKVWYNKIYESSLVSDTNPGANWVLQREIITEENLPGTVNLCAGRSSVEPNYGIFDLGSAGVAGNCSSDGWMSSNDFYVYENQPSVDYKQYCIATRDSGQAYMISAGGPCNNYGWQTHKSFWARPG